MKKITKCPLCGGFFATNDGYQAAAFYWWESPHTGDWTKKEMKILMCPPCAFNAKFKVSGRKREKYGLD